MEGKFNEVIVTVVIVIIIISSYFYLSFQMNNPQADWKFSKMSSPGGWLHAFYTDENLDPRNTLLLGVLDLMVVLRAAQIRKELQD